MQRQAFTSCCRFQQVKREKGQIAQSIQLITREVFQYPEALIQMLARYTPTNTMLMFTWDIIITPTIHMSCLHFLRTWSLANMSCYCCQFQTILCTLEIDDQCRGHRIKQKDHLAETPPTHKASAGAEPAICSHIRKHFQKTRNTAQTNKTKIIVAQRH